MNTKLVYVLVLIAVIVIAGCFLLFGKDGQTIIDQTVGSAVGPESTNDYQCYNGVCEFYRKQTMLKSTTTICALKSPNATTTLLWGGVDFSVSSTSASTVTIAKATTAYATTTIIGTATTIPANEKAYIVASSTPTGAAVTTVAPNTYIVVGMAGGAGTMSPTGTCDFKLIGNGL